jgi:hypothetical protein
MGLVLPPIEAYQVQHLPIVKAYADKIGLVEAINAVVPTEMLVDQTQQLCCALFQAVWAKLGSKRLLWERMRVLFSDYALASMRQLFEALLYGFQKSSPRVTLYSS